MKWRNAAAAGSKPARARTRHKDSSPETRSSPSTNRVARAPTADVTNNPGKRVPRPSGLHCFVRHHTYPGNPVEPKKKQHRPNHVAELRCTEEGGQGAPTRDGVEQKLHRHVGRWNASPPSPRLVKSISHLSKLLAIYMKNIFHL